MVFLWISLAVMMCFFIYLTSGFTVKGSMYYQRASYLCEILYYQNLLSKDILYLDVIIDIMASTCAISIYFLMSMSNHLIISFDILLILWVLLFTMKQIFKNTTSTVR